MKKLNENRRIKRTPFANKDIETLSPDGFITPLAYGLQALLENVAVDGCKTVRWTQDPKAFLEANLSGIVERYAGILQLCGWDPQKVGKGSESYNKALDAYKMAIAGI